MFKKIWFIVNRLKVEDLGFTATNCICLNFAKEFLERPILSISCRVDGGPYLVQNISFVQVERMLAKVVEAGLTPVNSICLKVSKAFSTNPSCVYPAINVFYKITSLWEIMFKTPQFPVRVVRKSKKIFPTKAANCQCHVY